MKLNKTSYILIITLFVSVLFSYVLGRNYSFYSVNVYNTDVIPAPQVTSWEFTQTLLDNYYLQNIQDGEIEVNEVYYFPTTQGVETIYINYYSNNILRTLDFSGEFLQCLDKNCYKSDSNGLTSIDDGSKSLNSYEEILIDKLDNYLVDYAELDNLNEITADTYYEYSFDLKMDTFYDFTYFPNELQSSDFSNQKIVNQTMRVAKDGSYISIISDVYVLTLRLECNGNMVIL